MRGLIILTFLTLLLFGCGNAKIIDEKIVDGPIIDVEVPVQVEEPQVEEDTVIETVVDEPVEEIIQAPPKDVVNEKFEPSIDPHSDPRALLDTYHVYIGEALAGDDSRYADAYELISGYAKRTTGWAASLDHFKQFADVTINKYENTGTVYDFIEYKKYGTGYRVYYDSSAGEINYFVHIEDDLFYISSCSLKGCMYWSSE